jgi:hypothetical protein
MKTIKQILGVRTLCLGFALAAATIVAGSIADARIVRFEISRVESPTFEGRSFGDVGTYEKIVGRAYGEIDPLDRVNADITDITLAPTNENGKVEYSTDVYILKPVDMSKGNGRIFYEVVNRGSKTVTGTWLGVGGSNPTTAAQAGDGLPMRLGYTMVWSGWEDQSILPTGGNTMNASFPIALNPDGSRIVGRTIVETIFDNTTTMTVTLRYPVATLDKSQHSLLVHNHHDEPLVTVPASDWSFDNERTLRINRTSPFLSAYDAGAAYQFIFLATDPVVNGLGYAAPRDVVSFLRHDNSAMNPLKGGIQYAIAHGYSQSGRYLKEFIQGGFNEDEDGRMVFEGVNPHAAGSNGNRLGERFGDSNVGGRGYEAHDIGKFEFPFTYPVLFDPISGKTDGILARCRATETCPRVMHTDGSAEWSTKAASLIVTDSSGNDLDLNRLAPEVRVYFFASVQHAPVATPVQEAFCQQLSNPNPWRHNLRALFVVLDEWATMGKRPPPSTYPKLSDGTRVRTPVTAASLGWPAIPGVTFTGFYNQRALEDTSILPPVPIPGTNYGMGLPKADADGNDIAGIRSPLVEVPVATYTGWAVRRAGFAEGEECDNRGQYIAFPATQADRLATGDPRLSIEERYRNHGQYVSRVARAADRLVRQRFLLEEDAQAFIKAAAESDIGK